MFRFLKFFIPFYTFYIYKFIIARRKYNIVNIQSFRLSFVMVGRCPLKLKTCKKKTTKTKTRIIMIIINNEIHFYANDE